MFKRILLGSLLLSNICMAAPLDIDPSNPPSARVLDNEKARLNLLNNKIDEFLQSHAIVLHGENLLKNEVMPEASSIVAKYTAWKDKLFLIKNILADIGELTSSQQDVYRAKILEVMSELYDIRKQSQDLRSRSNAVASDISLVRNYDDAYITAGDSAYFSAEADLFNKFNAFKANTLSAFDNVLTVINQDIENNMALSINTTKDIVDELFIIRSLDYPELASLLEELRQFTISNEVIEPRLQEVRATKNEISRAVAEYRPYAAIDLYTALTSRVTDLNNEIENSGLNQTHIANGTASLNHELSEAYNFVDQPLYFPLHIKQRYSLLGPIANTCQDVNDDSRYSYNCSALKGIYGINPQTVLTFDEEKLRYLEQQIDRVILGAMGQ